MNTARPDSHEPAPQTKSGGTGSESGGEHGRALVLGFDAEFAAVVCDVLSHAFELRMTTRIEVALGLLASRTYDAVVIETSAPGGIPLKALIEQVRTWQPTAAIIITSQRTLLSRAVIECFDADADDYILAPFHPGEFLARVVRRTAVRHGVAARATAPMAPMGAPAPDGHHEGARAPEADRRSDAARDVTPQELIVRNKPSESRSYGPARTRELASAVR